MSDPTRAAAEPPSLAIQQVLYSNDPADVLHALENLAHSVALAQRRALVGQVQLSLGDCSPSPVLAEPDIDRVRAMFEPLWAKVDVTVFGANLGSAAGHNRLLTSNECLRTLILNPDALVAPLTISSLMRSLAPGVGIVEARQLPLEHPKDYDSRTGDTSWASTACALMRTEMLAELDGFDATTFFLYCDDVDLSWRARLAGWRVVFDPAASVFHDKRLGDDGLIGVTPAEIYYSAEAALMLTHKYSRPDLVASISADLAASPHEAHNKAVAEYRRRQEEDLLPAPIDPEGRVAQFVGGAYAIHRF
ncbi:glycosyltransferase [Jatrophihabitans telluris]|uniref:Glycosyltransferase n=1 Tax=Jatrophihabitans telluris TaxID=2038343 RepID=A0ABY4QXT9_9ACTN|nr:glycosyltransferase [Jatrophihabitans telluris]UQX88184.1 glycosyltransferase [Jatrophihabitans telluris]